LTEALRVEQHGFTQAELDRAVSRRIRSLEKSLAELNNTESDTFAAEIIRHALTGEYVPGIERELIVNREALSEISLAELQPLVDEWMTEENRVIMASGPSHDEGDVLPSEAELLSVFEKGKYLELDAYEDGMSDQPLIQADPEPGVLTKRSEREDLELTILEFSNNTRILLKPTDFKHDEILVQAWRAGGMNLADDSQWLSARMAASVAQTTGMGSFSTVDLQKKLSGKLVGLSASFSIDQDQLEGSASPQDLETLLQLIHLRFTTVREDPAAFAALQERLREGVRNRLSDPKAAFGELVTLTLSQFHPRREPLRMEDVDQMNMQDSLAFFSSRFSNASGFTFLFTGNVDPETFIPLAEKWLASLPDESSLSPARFLDTDFPKYELRRVMRKGLEPISQVQMVWATDDFEWTYGSRHQLQSLIATLRIRLREELREEQGGTYHVSAWTPLRHYPEPRAMVRIAFSCDPERVEDLIESVYTLIDEIREAPLEESYAQKVREGQLRRRETDLQDNRFWSYVLPFYDWHGEDPSVILDFESYVDDITAEKIHSTAEEFFQTPHHSVYILYPESPSSEAGEEIR
jgi:zinc protease